MLYEPGENALLVKEVMARRKVFHDVAFDHIIRADSTTKRFVRMSIHHVRYRTRFLLAQLPRRRIGATFMLAKQLESQEGEQRWVE